MFLVQRCSDQRSCEAHLIDRIELFLRLLAGPCTNNPILAYYYIQQLKKKMSNYLCNSSILQLITMLVVKCHYDFFFLLELQQNFLNQQPTCQF